MDTKHSMAQELPSHVLVEQGVIAIPEAIRDAYRPGDRLLKKLDGNQCSLGAACELDFCGERMPLGFEPMSASERNDLRRWVDQGAVLD